MRTIHRDIVSALIFSKDGKLFQGMKDPDKGGVYADCWHIPGGGADEGEDKVTALKREILEETGIDISSYPVTLIDNQGRGEAEKVLPDGERVLCEMKFYVYNVTIADKNVDDIQVNLRHDLKTYRWTDLQELPSLKLTPPSQVLFKRLGYL